MKYLPTFHKEYNMVIILFLYFWLVDSTYKELRLDAYNQYRL